MRNNPFIKARVYSKWTSPLAGTHYSNKHFEESCFVKTDRSTQHQESVCLISNKSTPTSLVKTSASRTNEGNPEFKSEMLLKSSKISELSQRLSNPVRKVCSRSKWTSHQSCSDIN